LKLCSVSNQDGFLLMLLNLPLEWSTLLFVQPFCLQHVTGCLSWTRTTTRMSNDGAVTAVILLSTQYLLTLLQLIADTVLLALIVKVVLFAGRIAWRSVHDVLATTDDICPVKLDVLAAGDQVGLRRLRRQRRVAVDRGVFAHARNIFAAIAVSCRHYYED